MIFLLFTKLEKHVFNVQNSLMNERELKKIRAEIGGATLYYTQNHSVGT